MTELRLVWHRKKDLVASLRKVLSLVQYVINYIFVFVSGVEKVPVSHDDAHDVMIFVGKMFKLKSSVWLSKLRVD